MSILSFDLGLHPSFDALSAFVDQSDVDAARTRTGRHVARCAACRATVAELRALGTAARDLQLPGAPAGMWERIAAAQQREAAGVAVRVTPPPDAVAWTDAPSLRPTMHLSLPKRPALRRAVMGLAAAAAVLALLLVPTSRGERLQAGAARGSWRFAPARPAPGATVNVRYLPSPSETLPAQLLLLGDFAAPGDALEDTRYDRDALLDSLGILERQDDGTFVGRFVAPPRFAAVVLRLVKLDAGPATRVMTTNGPVSREPQPVALLVGGTASGAPSYASLTSALTLWTGDSDSWPAIGDTLMKYFPSEPAGYAVAGDGQRGRVIDALIAWFRTGEQQYLKFDKRFMAEPRVSVEHMVRMIQFAHRIDEPAEARKWTMRLAREHPTDPRALYMYGALLQSMLSRHGTIDSVRRDLPLADTLWERNGHAAAGRGVGGAAHTIGEREVARRWNLRAVQAELLRPSPRDIWRLTSVDYAQYPELRRPAEERLRAGLATPCVLPSGKYPRWRSAEGWRADCELQRSGAYGALSVIARLDGEPQRALALADSALRATVKARSCWETSPRLRRGEALLALGDTAGAADELAWGGHRFSWQGLAYRDSAGRLLRPAIDSARWAASIARAEASQTRCLAEATAARGGAR